MSEIITIQVGQCGNQIGSVFWPLILEEYGIRKIHTSSASKPGKLDKSLSSFFNCPEGIPKSCSIFDLRKSKVTARALLIDMEQKVVERFQRGGLHYLFDKKCLLTNHPGSGNNWAVGAHTHFKAHADALEDALRRQAERCDRLAAAFVLFSLAGGTGSGLGSALVSLLDEVLPSVDRLVTCVHPGGCTDVVTSPYNVALSLRVLSEQATCVIPVDNKALSDICIRHKQNLGVKPFHEVNNLIVNMLSTLTSGSRFGGPMPWSVGDVATMAPRPGLHYLAASLGPLSPIADRMRDLVHEVCSVQNRFLRVGGDGDGEDRMFGAALLCRGDVTPFTLRQYVHRFRSKCKFAAWAEPGIKAGLCSVPSPCRRSALLCLANSTGISRLFSDSLDHFNMLYRRKAHVHHYTNIDGFESEDFSLCQESLQESILKYSEAVGCIEVPRLVV